MTLTAIADTEPTAAPLGTIASLDQLHALGGQLTVAGARRRMAAALRDVADHLDSGHIDPWTLFVHQQGRGSLPTVQVDDSVIDDLLRTDTWQCVGVSLTGRRYITTDAVRYEAKRPTVTS